jgi:thymidylate synthase (FAD)
MKISKMSVELVDHLGSDISVVNAARVSFAKQSEWVIEVTGNEDSWHTTQRLDAKDVKLINYLAKHAHWSPFAHAFVSFRIKAPIFVARQLVKHQVGLAWNEVSRRYVDDEPEFWFPKDWRGKPINAKQGSSNIVFHAEHNTFTGWLTTSVLDCLDTYQRLLRDGVAPEQARMVLPQNTMTEWIWSGSLAAFCRVCNLRLDPHAQQECRELVGALAALLEPLFPVSYNALVNNVKKDAP